MAVKDLVGLYERSSSSSQTSRRQAPLFFPLQSPTYAYHAPHDSVTTTDDCENMTAVNDSNDLDDLSDTLDITEQHTQHSLDSDLNPISRHRTSSEERASLLKSPVPPLPPDSENDEKSTVISLYNTGSRKLTKPSSDRPHFSTHTPVPATVLFSRSAAPLYLPNLDSYLEAIPPPALETYGAAKEGAPGTGMFPPMDRLAQSGKSIDDLESNKTPTPGWRNKSGIFGALLNAALGVTGSSAVATFYSLQGLANTVQIFALIMNTIVSIKSQDVWAKWKQVIFGTIPNIIALNFASTLIQNLIFLLIFMALAGGLLYTFYRATWPSPGDSSTASSERYNATEGLIRPEPISTGRQWTLVLVSFLLTSIYLPLSTMAIHVLVWSDDLWVIPPTPQGAGVSLAAPDERVNICWTTTTKRNEINWAPAFIVVAAVVFIFLTCWFPYMLRQVIKQSVPKVDPYTDLGRKRSSVDMDNEYRRLLDRDENPFSFLYSGFRRGNGTYISTYLLAKLSALAIVSVISPTNCLFNTFPSKNVLIARQVLLLVCTIMWFGIQCWIAPFLDPVSNAGEWISRLNFILTAAVALAVFLIGENGVAGKILDTYVLYAIYIITYGLTIYFTVIHFGFMRRFVKRIARRIDFSIDIFSPRLDLSPNAIHVKRRVWQESITTLLLTSPECSIPQSQRMAFAQARDSEYPPYLIQFSGSPGERHVENLRILREVGLPVYAKAVALANGPDASYHEALRQQIQKYYTGPDCYWRDPRKEHVPGCTKYFGNAWWIPFPPTLAIRYDDGPLAVLTEAREFREYIEQNASTKIRRRREIRVSLRAIEGQRVWWPYEHTEPIGLQSLWCCGDRYQARSAKRYEYATLEIVRRGYCPWQDKQLGSGFEVQLRYGKTLVVSSTVFGLNEDYELTPPLAHFLALNRRQIGMRLQHLEAIIAGYREHHRAEFKKKLDVMSYRFLTNVYDMPRDPAKIAESAIVYERDLRVRRLLVESKDIFHITYRRMRTVTRSPACVWWYIFWDDLWRRNHDTIAALELHATDFNPHYPSSIAYSPLPRPALESFLIQRGLMSNPPKWTEFFHHGFLNKLYLRLNDAVFPGSKSTAILFHVGDRPSELFMQDVDKLTQGQPSTVLGTGGGTDHDADSIRARPTYRWEGLLNDPYIAGRGPQRRSWFAKMGAWFGITPLWRSGIPSRGISLDLRLEETDGGRKRYVLLDSSRGI